MNHKEHLLTCLAEECAELSQAATKALRFGVDDMGPGEVRTNGENIQHEFNDVLAIIEMLAEQDVVPLGDSRPVILQKKKDKVTRYMEYAVRIRVIAAMNPFPALLSLLELAEKATAGEWRAEEEDTDSGLNPDWFVQAICGGAWDNIAACGNDAWEDNWEYTAEQRKANAEFIAAARNAIPALKSLLASNQWQPIETAPKDGRRVLLAYADGEVREGWWHATANPPCALWRNDSGRPMKMNPIHWRPFPPAPTEPGRE